VNDFYVYIIYRPNGQPCYVGKGRGRRIRRDDKRKTNQHLNNIMLQSIDPLHREKIEDGLTESEAFALEIRLIKEIGREPHWPLVNMTDGGEGPSGYRVTADTRSKISAASTGKIKTREHLRAIGIALKNSNAAKDQRRKIQDAKIGKRRSREVVERIRRALSGKKMGAYSADRGAAITAGKLAGAARRRAETGKSYGLGYKEKVMSWALECGT
jgi:hypothetical protein